MGERQSAADRKLDEMVNRLGLTILALSKGHDFPPSVMQQIIIFADNELKGLCKVLNCSMDEAMVITKKYLQRGA